MRKICITLANSCKDDSKEDLIDTIFTLAEWNLTKKGVHQTFMNIRKWMFIRLWSFEETIPEYDDEKHKEILGGIGRLDKKSQSSILWSKWKKIVLNLETACFKAVQIHKDRMRDDVSDDDARVFLYRLIGWRYEIVEEKKRLNEMDRYFESISLKSQQLQNTLGYPQDEDKKKRIDDFFNEFIKN